VYEASVAEGLFEIFELFLVIMFPLSRFGPRKIFVEEVV
jgi:hypothetical protein